MGVARILHVGGDEQDARALKRIIRADPSLEIRFVSASEAIAAVSAQAVDVLVLDVNQPSHDVLQLMRAAGAHGPARRVPILVAGSADMTDRVHACLLRGADDYLIRPFDEGRPLLTLRRVSACLYRRRLRETTRFSVNGNALTDTSTVRLDTSGLNLRPASPEADPSHRFVPREFLEHLDRRSAADVQLGDHVQLEMTVLFTDIRDFTQYSESLTPQENFGFLTEYIQRVAPIIRTQGGFVDKYLGDGVMALFPGSPGGALHAAVELQRTVMMYNRERARNSEQPIRIGVGLHRGSLILGTIGEAERMQTTVIADSVNLASRIEGMTKTFGVPILVSGSVIEGLDPDHTFRLRHLGAVKAKGKAQSAEIYECYDTDPEDLIVHKDRTATQFTAGMAEFRKGMFLSAGRIFQRIAELHKDDVVAAYFRDRCSLTVVRDRGRGPWDGAETMEVK